MEELGTYDWEPVSVFLSHQAKFKVEVAALKQELEYYGTKCFVAHEDIQPTQKWLKEIKRALKDCTALVALLTPDFRESLWTDHEIGVAIGLKKLVIPVRLGRDPYGFMASIQALKGELTDPRLLAEHIVRTMLRNESTSELMKNAVIDSFFHSENFDTAIRTSKLLVEFHDLTDDQYSLLGHAVEANDQIYRATGVRKRMEAFLDEMEAD
ncbi:MAG: toll/interleukin-1 receptor domain-containing protein [Flavobacteriales bacterium]